jgi:hypothetical protein
MQIFELAQNLLDFFSGYKDRVLPGHICVLTILVINVAERNIRRIVLQKSKAWTTRDSGR